MSEQPAPDVSQFFLQAGKGIAEWGERYRAAFEGLSEAMSRTLTPERIMRAAIEGYNERMAEINRR